MQAKDNRAIRTFEVIPPPTYATAFLVVLGGVLPLLIIVGMLWFRRMDSEGLIRFIPVLVGVAALMGLSLLAMKRRSVALVDAILDVRAALFHARTPVADLDLERARVVDLADRMDLRPAVKMLGMSLPGFHAGRFRLRGKLAKAFCLITDRQRVLWLPLRNGKDQLLLSVDRPQALLEVLRATMDARPQRG